MTRQQENFRALMNNWGMVGDLVNKSVNSTGTATERMGIYLDSIEAKTNELKAAWEGFIMSLQQSDGFKQAIEWLTDLLEMLEHVDWQMVGTVATITGLIALLPKVVSGIKSIQAAIDAGKGISSLFSANTLTLILAAVSAIATIVTMIKSAEIDLDNQLEDISERKEALEEESNTVTELYKKYSELSGKAEYYSLTAQEKQQLVDVSKELVEKYGLEAEGVDTLTGAYQLATGAMQDFIDKQEFLSRQLTEEEVKTKTEKAKESYDDYQDKGYSNLVGKSSKELQEILDGFSTDDLTMIEDSAFFGKDILDMGDLGDKLKDLGLSSGEVNDIYKTARESLDKVYDADDPLQERGEYLLEQIKTEIVKRVADSNNTLREFSDNVVSILQSELNEDVPTEVGNLIQDSLEQLASKDELISTVESQGGVEDFLENYTFSFVNIVNTQGEDIQNVLTKFQELQQKAEAGTLKAGEYDDYQNALRVYIGLQEEALRATGLSEDKIAEFTQSLGTEEVSNLNVQLLELQENMKESSNYSDVQKSNFEMFSNQILSLNQSFKDGKISTQDYYNQLSQLINGVDPTNIEQITNTFGDLNNYLVSMGGVFQDTTNYLSSIWKTFQGGGDSLEFLNNFLPAAQQIQSLADNMIKLDEASSAIDLDTREDNTADIDMSTEDIQREVKTRYDVEVDTEDIDKAKEIINELDGQDVQVYIEEQGAENVEDSFENVLNYVDDITDGSAELTDSVGELGSALNDLAELDFNSVDSAFETLSKAFDDLPEGATSLVGTTDAAVQQAAQSMANWMIDVANSQKEYANIAQQYLIETSNAAGNAISNISEVNSDIIAQALMTDTANVNNFAANANKIAQMAMSTAVQKLGAVLSAMGNAIANLDIEIPLSLDGISENAKVGPFDIPVEIPNIKTVFKIGGEGTKGLSGIGDALKGLGDTLQDPAVSNVIASQFTPVQANYTPTPDSGSPGSKGSPGSYSPKGSGGSGGGGKSDADKAAEEAAQLAEDIAAFREDEGTALEDITEELINHYRLEKTRLELQKENLDYANDLLDAEENTTQWIKVQNQLLTNQRKQIQELYRTNSKIEQQMEKIQSENPQYDINSWFDEAGNDTLDYINLINSFAQQERDYRATVTLNSQEDIDNAEKHIKELQKQRDYVENLHDSVSQLKEAWIDNGNELQDLFSEMNDTLKEMRDTLLDKFMTALEDRVDEVNQAYEDNIDKLDSLITVQERYNDVINSSLQTQADLRKELQSNKDSYQYLDDYMRSIIFNEGDYKELSKELDKVMSDMNALSDEYQYKINNLTEDEMYMLDEITNEYERQVDLKEKEYEILQAQLDVVKARTQLENARNERTVRIFTNGEWQWVKIAAHVKHRKLLGTREAT